MARSNWTKGRASKLIVFSEVKFALICLKVSRFSRQRRFSGRASCKNYIGSYRAIPMFLIWLGPAFIYGTIILSKSTAKRPSEMKRRCSQRKNLFKKSLKMMRLRNGMENFLIYMASTGANGKQKMDAQLTSSDGL